MAKEYGVYKEGTDVWVKTITPLEYDIAAEAETWTESEAMGIASYLTITEGIEHRVGRPDDRHG